MIKALDIFNGRTVKEIVSDGDINWADKIVVHFTDDSSITFGGAEGIFIESDELAESQRKIREQQTAERIQRELERDEKLKTKYPGIT